jgi:hypothetical protein
MIKTQHKETHMTITDSRPATCPAWCTRRHDPDEIAAGTAQHTTRTRSVHLAGTNYAEARIVQDGGPPVVEAQLYGALTAAQAISFAQILADLGRTLTKR